MMTKWTFIAAGAVVTGVAAFLSGQARESSRIEGMLSALRASATLPPREPIDFASFRELPPPVARYFRRVLTDGQRLIEVARLRQSGVLRTSTTAERWSPFTARQFVAPRAIGFLWDAKVKMLLPAYVRVLDCYITGIGSACAFRVMAK